MSGKRRASKSERKRSRQADRHTGRSRWRLIAGAGVVILAAIAAFTYGPKLLPAGGLHESDHVGVTVSAELEDAGISIDGLLNYCAFCHAKPAPEMLPRDRWPRAVEHMNAVIIQNNLGPALTTSQVRAISNWYVERAPQQYPPRPQDGYESPLRFTPTYFGEMKYLRPASGGPPSVTDIKIVDLDQDGTLDVLLADLGNSAVMWVRRSADGSWHEQKLASIPAPAQLAVADITGNGHLDIVVPDLGTIKPTDDLVGRVVLLVNDGRMNFTPIELRRDLPRTSDAQAADLNGNGRLDILTASFGLYTVGEIGWFEHLDDGTFEYHRILQRNGASHVRVTDLTGNGLPDFVALVSQEHQEVLAFVNMGEGQFVQRLIYKAPHFMWGFSSLELVDLDGDGRIDILLANGDALDIDHEPKPWHGVQWLRNMGNLEFEPHTLAHFHGAYRAIAVDLNRNGHLDIVVPSMANHWDDPVRQSIIWLENDGNLNFTPRLLSDSPTSLVTVAAGDLTGNGWADILAGGLYVSPSRQERAGRATLFANLGRAR